MIYLFKNDCLLGSNEPILKFLGIPLSFDPAACVLAGAAVLIAWIVFRSTNYHRSKLVELNYYRLKPVGLQGVMRAND